MAVTLVVNGTGYSFPNTGDESWGDNVTNWATAVTASMLQKTGGTFTLSADVDFGTSFGLKSLYYKSRSALPATTGQIRLGTTEVIAWRNNANSANLPLTTDASDNLTWNGGILASSAGVVPVASGGTGLTSYTTGDTLYASAATTLSKLAIGAVNTVGVSTGTAPSWALLVNANISGSAAIAYSKLALTGAVLNGDLAGSIAYAKLATLNTGQVLAGNAGTPTATTIGGDVSIGATGTATISALAVTAAKMGSGAATANQVATADGSGNVTYTTQASLDASNFYTNGSMAASVSANALTIALKDKSGADAAAGSKVQIGFRNVTATTGTYTFRAVTAALSIVVPASTTIGTTSGVPCFIFVYAIDNAGTVELAVSLSNALEEASVLTTVAVSGGTSATTLYSTTARTSVPIRLIGRIAISEAAAGTWATSPTEVSNLPIKQGRQIVRGTAQTSASANTGTAFTAFTSNVTVTFTPIRTGVYRISSSIVVFNASAGTTCTLRLNATAGTPTVIFSQESAFDGTASGTRVPLYVWQDVQVTAGTAYTFQIEGKAAAGTLTLSCNIPTNGIVILAEEL